MTEDGPEDAAGACTSCGESVPEGRSVCPSCGTLQPGQPPPTVADEDGDLPGFTGAAGPLQRGPHADDDVDAAVAPERRRFRLVPVAIIALVVIAAVTAGAVAIDRRGDDDIAATTTVGDGPAGRVAAIRGFCDEPAPLTRPAGIAAFSPGAGAVAFIDVPRPPSSTEPAGEITVQVSPEVGTPDLTLDEAVNLVSLAVCLDQTKSRDAGGTCDYTLTNVDSIGEEASAPLLVTSYDIELRELLTGKVLVDGTLTTPVDRCPDLAYLDPDRGVSNSLSDEQILDWVSTNLAGGKPA